MIVQINEWESPFSLFSGKLRLCDGTHAEAAVTKKKAKKRSAALPQKRCTNI